jgi:hypothetical protein
MSDYIAEAYEKIKNEQYVEAISLCKKAIEQNIRKDYAYSLQ